MMSLKRGWFVESKPSSSMAAKSFPRAGSHFCYESGAIENSKIRGTVVQILEGTEPAFKNRQSKYRLQQGALF